MAIVVTPFIMQDKRNWQRIVKVRCLLSVMRISLRHNVLAAHAQYAFSFAAQYYKRGFDTYGLDQNCRHETQCVSGLFAVEGQAGIEGIQHEEDVPRDGSTIDNHELTSLQDQNGRISCCCGETRFPCSLVLFEKQQSEASEFFANLYGWCDLKIANINSLHPWRRVAGLECRRKYENFAFMKRNSDGYSMDSVDDLLRENNAYVRYQEDPSIFAPHFTRVVFSTATWSF
jgi:hypothetical protein